MNYLAFSFMYNDFTCTSLSKSLLFVSSYRLLELCTCKTSSFLFHNEIDQVETSSKKYVEQFDFGLLTYIVLNYFSKMRDIIHFTFSFVKFHNKNGNTRVDHYSVNYLYYVQPLLI